MKVQVIQSTASALLSTASATMAALRWSWKFVSRWDSMGKGSCKNLMK